MFELSSPRLRMAAVLVAVAAGAAPDARAETLVKFALDWQFQGPTSPFLVAVQRGYYKDEGLTVTLDAGSGSAEALARVASGAYDMGFADINALIEHDARNPKRAVQA